MYIDSEAFFVFQKDTLTLFTITYANGVQTSSFSFGGSKTYQGNRISFNIYSDRIYATGGNTSQNSQCAFLIEIY